MNIDLEKTGEDRLREIWSVHEFARQYRLDRLEESRLKMLHGPYATVHELLSSRRQSSVW
jgi:hypothetical protein